MKLLYTFYVIIFIYGSAIAQKVNKDFNSFPINEKIKIYYSEDFKISNKDSADYYRELVFKDKNIPYSDIEEYSIDGKLKRIFYADFLGTDVTGRDSTILNGPVTYYFKSGIPSKRQFYINNIQIAAEVGYYESGEEKYVKNYIQGLVQGEEIGLHKNGNIKFKRNYLDGLIQGIEKGFYNDGNLKYEKIYDNNVINGNEKIYYPSGKILAKKKYLNGKINGLEINYYENGNISFKVNYMNGLKQGDAVGYYNSGEQHHSVSFKDNVKHGKEIYLYKNGNLRSSCDFVRGIKNGTCEFFYSSGKVEISLTFIEGIKNGEEIGFFENGNEKFIRNYTNGLLNGKETHFDIEGNKVSEKKWSNNIIDGEFLEFFKSGEIMLKGSYVNGVRQLKNTYYYKSGEKKSDVEITNGKKNGKEIVYFKNGEIKSECYYQNDKKNGEYFENSEETGEVIYRVNYTDGLKFGEEISYFSSCLPSSKTDYVNGIKTGEQIFYHESNGEIKSVVNLDNNMKEGEKTTYYDSGELFSYVNYLNNKKNGDEMGYFKDGKRMFIKSYTNKSFEYKGVSDERKEVVQYEYTYYNSGEKESSKYYSFQIESLNDDGNQLQAELGTNNVKSHTTYYKNGTIKSVFEYDGLNPIFETGYYDIDIDSISSGFGEKLFERKYVDGLIQGEEITYHKSGKTKSTVIYEAGKKQGLQVYYDEDGYEEYSILWENDVKKERRIALVIGNANYEEGDELLNPVNDARLMKESLEKLNFEVLLHENLETEDEMKNAITNFGRKRKDYDIAFVYYAGHGVQINNKNYLMPTKEQFNDQYDVQNNAVPMQSVLQFLESQRDGQLNFFVLDACRNNPFEKKWNTRTRSLGSSSGLAKIEPLTGSLIAYSTTAGQVAADGDDGNSLYTQVLASRMLEKDVAIKQVFQNVRNDVIELSNEKGFFQRPIEESLLTGGIYYLNKSSE